MMFIITKNEVTSNINKAFVNSTIPIWNFDQDPLLLSGPTLSFCDVIKIVTIIQTNAS